MSAVSFAIKESMGKPDARDAQNARNSLIPAGVGEEEFDNHVPDVAQYGRVAFWDDRYVEESEPFEWYHGYE
jgi:hypothetical protein